MAKNLQRFWDNVRSMKGKAKPIRALAGVVSEKAGKDKEKIDGWLSDFIKVPPVFNVGSVALAWRSLKG